ncbi:DUF4232 domain-containing protein [Streptomyces sp. NPDC021093]|uniref:DUF4232 domain-containing protein n=1 Tax=Streptomyces sp. NPDC021093 TaxID=3365112 RepID=UPI0037A65A36
MSARITRITRTARRTRLLAVSAVALTAALSLTACDNGEGSKDAGAANGSVAPTGGSAQAGGSDGKPADGSKPGQSGSTGNTGTTTGNGNSGTSTGKDSQGSQDSKGSSSSSSNGSSHTSGSSGSTGASDPNDPKNRAICDSRNIKITAQVVKRPIDTMLLTATNTGSKLCDFGGAPILRFEGAQSVPPAMEDTKGQAVTSIKPGESAYAAVKLTQGDKTDDPGYWAKTLSVGFYNIKQKPLDGFVNVPLSGKDGVYIDSSVRVSYWQNDLDAVSSL